jgi:5-methyltetrahydropteroyltriglutamate--homocysteine methyltransferase
MLNRLRACRMKWARIDERGLVADLPDAWLSAYRLAYGTLVNAGPKRLLATSSGSIADRGALLEFLPLAGLDVDTARMPSLRSASFRCSPGRRCARASKSGCAKRSRRLSPSRRLTAVPS